MTTMHSKWSPGPKQSSLFEIHIAIPVLFPDALSGRRHVTNKFEFEESNKPKSIKICLSNKKKVHSARG